MRSRTGWIAVAGAAVFVYDWSLTIVDEVSYLLPCILRRHRFLYAYRLSFGTHLGRSKIFGSLDLVR